jgi:hypothetical protein
MQSITLKISTEAAEQLDSLARQYIKDYIKLGKGRPPLSHTEWLAKHPDGKQFMHDCMQYKYLKLTQGELTKLSMKLYYETYSMVARYGTTHVRPPTLREAKNAVIIEAILRTVQVSEKPVLSILSKKNI